MKIIITENQLRLIKEAVGVPEGIMQAADQLYEIVSDCLKNISVKRDEYKFKITDQEIVFSDIILNKLNISVSVEQVDNYEDEPIIASMGVSNEFRFDEGIMMSIHKQDKSLYLEINFIVNEYWDPEELLDSFQKDMEHTTSVLAHELKHRYDKFKKKSGLVGDIAKYQSYASQRLRFGIPVLTDFMRHSYYIQATENLVRPTEVATRMTKKGITRQQFYEFIKEDETFKQLKEIKNFTYDYLIKSLENQMDRVEGLLRHAGEEPSEMSDKEKIETVLKIVYINLVNLKVENFDSYFYTQDEKINNMFGGIFGKLFGGQGQVNKEKEKIREKFINHVAKYENRELDFFKDECEMFNYVATKLMKKISKIYSLIPDEKEQTNESILNWDLHQKLMEKKYGKRPIQTSYNFKK